MTNNQTAIDSSGYHKRVQWLIEIKQDHYVRAKHIFVAVHYFSNKSSVLCQHVFQNVFPDKTTDNRLMTSRATDSVLNRKPNFGPYRRHAGRREAELTAALSKSLKTLSQQNMSCITQQSCVLQWTLSVCGQLNVKASPSCVCFTGPQKTLNESVCCGHIESDINVVGNGTRFPEQCAIHPPHRTLFRFNATWTHACDVRRKCRSSCIR